MGAYRPRTLDEALELVAAHPEALPVAGATDVMVELNAGRLAPRALLDLSHLAELQGWDVDDGRYVLGSGMTFARIAEELDELTALAEAARTVGSPQIRRRATIGGNLVTASPAGDSLPVLAAYDARIRLASIRGTRTLPWHEFLVGPKRTSLAPGELVVAVEFDAPPGAGSFAKVGPRGAMVIAIAGVCLQLDEERRALRVALGSVGPTILRAPEAERYGAGIVDWDGGAHPSAGAFARFGGAVAAAARPIDDLRGSAIYRRHVVNHLSQRALQWALDDRRAA